MNCNKARSQLAESLSLDAGQGLPDRLESHLAGCAACRRQWEEMTSLWEALAEDPTPVLPRADASRLLDRLVLAQRAIVTEEPPSWGGAPARRWVAAAAILAAMCLGALLSRSAAALRVFPMDAGTPTTAAERQPDSMYLLLLHRPEGQIPERRGARYQEWADRLRANDQLVTAHALDSAAGWMVTDRDPLLGVATMSSPVGQLEGFFLIAADDLETAIDAARTSPHVGYGGAIEVRRIAQ